MTPVGLTLVSDGSSDVCLVPIIEWIVREVAPELSFRVEVARNLPPLRAGLRARVDAALRLFPCRILLVHRDAETTPRTARVEEIRRESRGVAEDLVPVVPVRMSEAWLLSNVEAIRKAAGNPNGTELIDLPNDGDWEALPDPKRCLEQAIIRATGLNVRRRRKFNVHRARIRVAELTNSFDPLRRTESFRAFERDMREVLGGLDA